MIERGGGCMVYIELGCEPLFIHICKNVIKYWLKVILCDNGKLISIVYRQMLKNMIETPTTVNWATLIKDILFET